MARKSGAGSHATLDVGGRGVPVSNLDKPLFPAAGLNSEYWRGVIP